MARKVGLLRYDYREADAAGLARSLGVVVTPTAVSPMYSGDEQYPHGVTQPGAVAVARDGSVLYRWILQPEIGNAFGAMSRVVPADVVAIVQAKLAGHDPDALGLRAKVDPQRAIQRMVNTVFCGIAALGGGIIALILWLALSRAGPRAKAVGGGGLLLLLLVMRKILLVRRKVLDGGSRRHLSHVKQAESKL